MPVGWAIAGAAVIGAGASIYGANKQADAAQNAQNLQQGMFNQEIQNESPYMQTGAAATGRLADLMGTSGNTKADGYGSLTKQFNTGDWKSLSPQYGFNLQQGQQNTLNQDASSQGAESGAALKDLTSFNQNYANNSFNSAFQNYQTQQNNIFGRLSDMAHTGQAAASNQSTGASSFAGSIGNSAQNVGSALGGGAVGAGNSLSSGLSNGAIWSAYGGGGGWGGGGFTPSNDASMGGSTAGWGAGADAIAVP